jgi:hypothetical protein
VALVSQRQYAKRRGISQAAVWKRTTTAGGPIPTHGPRKLIDPAQADALWEVTMSPQGAANGRATAGAARATKGYGCTGIAEVMRRRVRNTGSTSDRHLCGTTALFGES